VVNSLPADFLWHPLCLVPAVLPQCCLFTMSHLDLELFRSKRAKVLLICIKNFY
jgi:hypothetical protein